MIHFSVLLSLIGFVYSTIIPHQEFHPSKTQIEDKVQQWMSEARVPGLSLAVISNNSKTQIINFGYKNAQKEPIDDNTIFEAASLTKVVFSYAVIQMAKDGDLDLDKPLDQYWIYTDAQPEKLRGKITARMILTHSSGFPNWRRPRDSKELPINFEPGSRFSYSGEGFVYLAKVIEQITGTPTDQWMVKMVFEPLGMDHSSMTWDEKLGKNFARPHDSEGIEAKKYKPKQPNAAASLHTTASDYSRFLIALIKSDLHRKMMLSTHRKLDPKCSQCRQPNSDPGFMDVTWGLGVGLEHGEESYIWHWGDNGNFKSYFCVSPDTGKGFVFFANSHHGLALRDKIVNLFLPGKHPAHKWVTYKQL